MGKEIDYQAHDNKLSNNKRKQKIEFANKMGYDHFTQMVSEKCKEGLTGGKIAKWINSNNPGFNATTSAIDHNLKAMGIYKYKEKYSGRNSGTKTPKIKAKRLVLANKLCTCCRLVPVKAGNRFLCNGCYIRNSATDRHSGANTYIGVY